MDKTSWDVFNNWDYQPVFEINNLIQGWKLFPPLFQSFKKCYELEKKEILRSLEIWNEKLESLGGDPSFINWRRFRPLQMDREEDWSDWLAHLIENSKTGYFSRALFGLSSPICGDAVIVDREPEYHGYRADLVVNCGSGSYLCVEVKTGDPNLEKTYETARKMREKYRPTGASWADFILLLESQVAQWKEIKDTGAEIIPYRTWENGYGKQKPVLGILMRYLRGGITNMKLSAALAAAVVQALVAKYGISSARLKAFGVGPLAPVASNDTPDGKAMNRRVELVKL